MKITQEIIRVMDRSIDNPGIYSGICFYDYSG